MNSPSSMKSILTLTLGALALAAPVRAGITDELVVHLTFDGTLADASGRGNNGAPVGTTPFVTGKVGSHAISLSSKPDGSSFNFVTLGAPADLNFGADTDFSVAFWVRFSQWVFDPPFLSNKDWLSGQNQGWMIATGTNGRLQWNYGGPPGLRKDYDGPGNTLSDGQWHHVAVTFLRAGEVITYLDGVEVDVRDVSASPNNLNTPAGFATNIGQDGTGRYTDGGTVGIDDLTMDDVGIWRRVLTAAEVRAIQTAGLAGNNLASVQSTPEPPVVTHPPQSQTVAAGSTVTLKVLPRGTSPFRFQWSRNGQIIPGATSATLSLKNIQAASAGSYTVEIQNSAGAITSPPAAISVDTTQPPLIAVQPLAQTTATGGAVTFRVDASGVEPLQYQWLKNGAPISGATTATYTISRAQADDAGSYSARITAGNGQSATSHGAALTLVKDITQNLVVHLTFDTNFQDSSGRNNHATAVGTPSIVAGKIGGGALRFSHDASLFNYLTLGMPDDLDFSVDADFSFSFWVKFSQWKRDPVFISNKSWIGSGANIGYAVATGADGRLQWNFREQVGERADFDTAAGAISDGRWHHVAISFQRGGDARTFLDGVLIDTQPLPTSETTIQPGFPTNIGQDGTGTYSENGVVGIEDGTLDDLAIWRRALTAEEILSIYRKGSTLGANVRERAITDDLVVHLPFDGSARDNSGRHNHGTKVGNPSFVPGKIGSGALHFSSAANGSSFNYVTLGAPADLDFGVNDDFSVSFWTRFTTWTGDPAFLSNKDWSSGGNQGWVIATAGNGRLQWNVGDGDAGGRTRYDYDGPAGTLSNGQWHHVAVTFDRDGNAVTYLDGQAVDSTSIAPDLASIDTPAGLATNIGQDGKGTYTDNGSVGIADGQIDDVAIWRRVLGADEVARIYSGGLMGLNVLNQPGAPAPLEIFPTEAPQVVYERDGVQVFNGGYGSGMAQHPTAPDVYYLMTDRGPNFAGLVANSIVLPVPDFAPQIGVFRLVNGELKKESVILLRDALGNPLTGLPNPIGQGGTGELALNLDGHSLALSPDGLDPEGLDVALDGTFWVSDEYGPHILHLDATGKTIERINPFGTGVGGRRIPSVFASRRANRGMEGLTLTPDGRKVVGIMQSQLDNPFTARAAIRAQSRVSRILVFDIETGATQQYIYILDAPTLTISEIRAVSNTRFIVLERDGNFPNNPAGGAAFKKFFEIDLTGATDISDPEDKPTGKMVRVNGADKTIEELALLQILDAGIVPVKKTLYLDLLHAVPGYPHDKPEGFSVLPDGRLAIINDDDFGIGPDGKGGIATKRLPATGQIDRNILHVVGPSPVTESGFKLQLVHSSDNESSFQDPNTLEKKILNYGAIKTGLDQLARRENLASLYVTAGDHTLPGPFYQASADAPELGAPGLADIALYNAMGLAANGIGNHEFDGGINDFARLLKAAKYPFIAVNLDFSKVQLAPGTPPIEIGVDGGSVQENAGKIVKSAFIEINGERIGLIGRAPAGFFQVIANPATTVPGLDFFGGRDANQNPLRPALPMVLEQVDLLKSKGINKIVLLDHAQDFTSDPLSTTALRDIDIVVQAGGTGFLATTPAQGPFNLLRPGDKASGGYPVMRTDGAGQPVLVVNTEQLYRYLGHLIVRFNDAGLIDWIDPRSGPIATTAEAVAALSTELVVPTLQPSAEVQSIFDTVANTPRIRDLNTVAGRTTSSLNGLRADVRTRETNLGRLAADSTLWFADRHLASLGDPRKVDIALKNGGGIRDTILGPNVTKFTIGAALAFNNQLSIVELTAAELIATMENAVSRFPSADGRFAQLAGAFIEFDPARPGAEGQATLTIPSRIKTLIVTRADGTQDVVVQNYQVRGDLGRTFVLATNSFLATGGDGYEGLKGAAVRGAITTTIGEQQILAEYIAMGLSGLVNLPEPLLHPRVVQIYPSFNFTAWSSRFYTPGLPGTLAGDDFDGDRITNFDEYAFALDPLVVNTPVPLLRTAVSNGMLQLTYRRHTDAALDWIYSAASEVIGPWRVLAETQDYIQTTTDLGNGVEQVTITVNPGAAGALFLQVRAETR